MCHKISGIGKIYASAQGGCHVSPSKTFCLTELIKIVGKPFCVPKKFWCRKFSHKGGGSFTVLSNIFLPNRTGKTSPLNHSVFQKVSGRGKNLWIRGGGAVSRVSVETCLYHSTEIIDWRTVWCIRKVFLSTLFMHRRTASRFCWNSCLTGRKRKAL